MSGLNQQFTKLSNLNWFREFESHRLRKGFREAKSLAEASEQTAHLAKWIQDTNLLIRLLG